MLYRAACRRRRKNYSKLEAVDRHDLGLPKTPERLEWEDKVRARLARDEEKRQLRKKDGGAEKKPEKREPKPKPSKAKRDSRQLGEGWETV